MPEKRDKWAWVRTSGARAALGWLAVLALGALLTPGFAELTWRDGRVFGAPIDVLHRSVPVFLAALGMTLVVGTGGVDLSVGSVAAIAAVVSALALRDGGWGALPAVAAALSVGALLGAWNGLLVRKLALAPIVATLVLFTAGRGLAQVASGGSVVSFGPGSFSALSSGATLALPNSIWTALGLFVLAWFALRRTSFGLYLQAYGDSPRAAELAGLPVTALTIATYGASALLAALAGVLTAAEVRAGDPASAGLYLELDAILATVLGGTSLRGGRVQLAGTLFGALILQTLTTLVLMHGARMDLALIAKALAVVAVCAVQSPRWREFAGGRRA